MDLDVAQPSADEPDPIRVQNPIALVVVAAVVGAGVAVVVAAVIGWLAFSSTAASCSPDDGWCALGAAIVAALSGAVAGGVGYLVAGVITIVRCRPPGRRAAHLAAHVGIAVVVVLLLGALPGLVV